MALEPETEDLLELIGDPDRLILASVKLTLRDLARRWQTLDAEAKALSSPIKALVEHVAPELIGLFGVSSELAGQFLPKASEQRPEVWSLPPQPGR